VLNFSVIAPSVQYIWWRKFVSAPLPLNVPYGKKIWWTGTQNVFGGGKIDELNTKGWWIRLNLAN